VAETGGGNTLRTGLFPDMKEQEIPCEGVGQHRGRDQQDTFIMYVAALTFAENSLHMTNAILPLITDNKALTDVQNAV